MEKPRKGSYRVVVPISKLPDARGLRAMEFIKAAPKQLARFVTFAALFAKHPRLALQPYETIDEATQPKVHGHSFFAALRALGVVLSR